MDSLHLPNAKLLYALAVLFKEKLITSDESHFLKGNFYREILIKIDLVINENIEISECLIDNPKENLLKERLLKLLKKLQISKNNITPTKNTDAIILDREKITSPLDAQLFDKKRKEFYIAAQENLPKSEQIDTEKGQIFGKNINPCDYGKSPVLEKTDLEKHIGYDFQ